MQIYRLVNLVTLGNLLTNQFIMAFQHKKESGMVGVKGHCKECDLTWEGGGTQLQATRHFQNTGHVIHVEQTIWWEWLPVIAADGKPKHKATKKKAIRRNRKK